MAPTRSCCESLQNEGDTKPDKDHECHLKQNSKSNQDQVCQVEESRIKPEVNAGNESEEELKSYCDLQALDR